MCAAINGVDVVGERIDLFVVGVVVLNRDLNRENVGFLFEVDRLVVERGLVLVQVLHKLRDAALVVKLVRAFRLFAFVLDRDPDSLVQECLFAQTLGKLVEAERERRGGPWTGSGRTFTGPDRLRKSLF